MDALLLSRIQFGLALGFHYLFPVTTLGLTFYILLFESIYLKTGKEIFKRISGFLIKLLGIVFVLGVATGLMLPFAFGTNFARLSGVASELFGVQLAIESMTSFALESVFLSILIFGRNRVSKKFFWISTLIVFFASHLSAFWIVSVNSWMQTPAGFIIEGGRIIITDYLLAVFNHTTIIRFTHVVTAAWLTGAVILSALAAWYLLKKEHEAIAKKMIQFGLIGILILSLTQLLVGHTHILSVLKHQPIKDAAMEGIFKTQNGAPLIAFGIPDAKNKRIILPIGIPYMLSFLESGHFNSEVKGLEEYPEQLWPPVNTVFTTFHLMVMSGMLMVGCGVLGFFLLRRKKLFETRWFLYALVFLVPFPYIANEMGWISAEIGRQPWAVTNVLKTMHASTITIPASHILTVMIILSLLYILLITVFLSIIKRIIKRGPLDIQEVG